MILKTVRTAIGYIRVSKRKQAKEGQSLEAQEEKIRAWCQLSNVKLLAVYCDAGRSGKRADNRPELQKAMQHATETGSDLIVYSLSRFARSIRDASDLCEHLAESDCNLVSLTESIDTSTAAGKMIFHVIAAFAQFEREVIAERTQEVMDFKRSSGERIGTVPYGFDVTEDDRLVPNAIEQETVARMLELRGSGLSFRGIAATLNGRGSRAKNGGEWNPSVIAKLVSQRG
jgi:site-specific DNA recombinase